MTRIFIEGYELDLTQGLSNQITYAIDDLQNIDSKSTSFTKTIVLPGTANNNKLLGNIFEFNNANFDNPLDPNVLANFNAARNATARIEIDGLQIMKGILRLLEIIHVDGNIEYECALFGELGGFINALGNKRLEDLDFSAYNHTYSYANIVASWNTTGSTGYCYPLVDYGNVSTDKVNFQYKTFKPALFVREYLNKIFTGSGYTYECNLFNTNTFRNLIVPNNSKQLTKETSDVLKLTKAINQSMNEGGSQDFVSYETKVGSLFTASASDTTFTYNGTPTLTTNITIELFGDYTLARRPLTIAVLKNGVAISGSSQTYNGTDLLYYNKSLSVTLATNDTLRVRTSCILDIGDEVNVSESTINVINNVATTAPIELGDTMVINNTIPKGIFQKDFVTSIMKMFNLMIVEDKYKTNHLVIKPYVEFYTGTIIDWSDKIDHSKAIKIKPMSEINARYYNFKYKQDNDFYNEDYRKKFNEGYGDIIYDNGLEFAKDSESVDVIFASSPLFGTASTDKVFPAIYKKSDNNLKEDPMDHIVRIMQINKISSVATWSILNGATNLGSNTAYLFAGHLNNPTTPSIDINFGAPQQLFFNLTSGDLSYNLFNAYYSPYMAEITDKDSRLLTGFFHLTGIDIFNLDFAKFYFIDGGLYRLIKVYDYSPDSNDTTKVDLLRVIDKYFVTIDTTPNWVSQVYNTCVSCVNYLVYRDLNPNSATYNDYQVNGVNVGSTAPSNGNCVTTANWVSQSYNTCVNCVNYLVYRDLNTCSATYNQYKVNEVIVGLTAPASGNCNVTPNFMSQGYNTCVDCVNYLVYRDVTPCSPTFNNYQVNGVNVGNTAPSNGNCNVTPNFVSAGYNTCVDCVTYLVYRDVTTCSPTFNNYRVNGVNVGSTAPVNGDCNYAASWTSQGYNTCVGCGTYLVYRDTNACSSTYNNYQVNGINVGNTAPVNGDCNSAATWTSQGYITCSDCNEYLVYRDTNICSITYNNYQVNGVNVGNTAPTSGYCTTAATWTSQGYNTCSNCVTYLVYRDTNLCSPTYNNYQVNGVNVGNTAPQNGNCITTALWVRDGEEFCLNCIAYQPQRDNNPCSATYNDTRNLSLGASSPCVYDEAWTSQGYNTCVNCVNYLVYRNTNPCSATYNNYRVNGVNVGNTAPTSGNCNTTANWVNNGSTFCSSCVAYQPQIDNNPCSATYNNTRNVNLGATAPCDYTANYSNNVGNLYVCNVVGGGVNTYIVYQNTNPCFTGNQFFANGNSYATNPSNAYPNTTQVWVQNGANYCLGRDLYQPQIQTNECAVNYNGVRDQLIEADSSTCAESYTMANCLGGGATTYSAIYPIGTFSVGERVTSSGVTYVITGTYTPFAGIVITSTGLTGCPQYTQFTDLCTSNAYYILGTGYSSVGTSSDIPTACLQPTGTTETPTGTQIYNFTSNPSCECV
jgi:hypothetical protein